MSYTDHYLPKRSRTDYPWGGRPVTELTAGGRTLVVTTHDDDFARDFATRVIILADGEVVEQGAPREVLTNPQHPATKALLLQSHTA